MAGSGDGICSSRESGVSGCFDSEGRQFATLLLNHIVLYASFANLHRRKNMEPSAQVRDAVLRSYIQERTWSINNEFKLLQAFVSRNYSEFPVALRPATDRMTRFHIAHPFLVEYEWEVAESRTDMGKGDLVFTDGGGRFAVVEVKFI
eukprot:ANDGO_07249.mRNA.1 hypothetical protein